MDQISGLRTILSKFSMVKQADKHLHNELDIRSTDLLSIPTSLFELFACWVIFNAFVIVWTFFSKLTFSKHFFSNTIILRSVKQFGSRSGPPFCQKCLQRLLADDKSPLVRRELTTKEIKMFSQDASSIINRQRDFHISILGRQNTVCA